MDGIGYSLDLEARCTLDRWQRLNERGRQLVAEPRSLQSFQPESKTPERVGLGELISDEFTPEELVEMAAPREPLVVDWDVLEGVA